MKAKDPNKLDRIVAEARRAAAMREQGYREQALKIYPWICGRCGREFKHANLRELTVHHRDHNHDNNPPDGSNWELLCLYCHDNEHQRQLEANANMMRRLKETGGEARRLFLLDQEPAKVAQAYRAHRIQCRRLGKQRDLRRLEVEFANLKRNVRRLIEEGCDVRVAFDGKESFKSLPDGMLTDPDDSSVAIYDSFRVDIQDAVGRGVIARAKAYCPAVHNFEAYLRSAEQYFQDLWETAQPAASFLNELQQASERRRWWQWR